MHRYRIGKTESDKKMLTHFLSLWPEWKTHNAEDLLKNRSWKIFVTTNNISPNAEIIACIIFGVVSPTAEVIDLFVLPTSRNLGHAKQLFIYASTLLQNQDKVSEYFLEVRPSNTPALSLYQNLGFSLFSERKKYYPDGENALILRKDMSHSP